MEYLPVLFFCSLTSDIPVVCSPVRQILRGLPMWTWCRQSSLVYLSAFYLWVCVRLLFQYTFSLNFGMDGFCNTINSDKVKVAYLSRCSRCSLQQWTCSDAILRFSEHNRKIGVVYQTGLLSVHFFQRAIQGMFGCALYIVHCTLHRRIQGGTLGTRGYYLGLGGPFWLVTRKRFSEFREPSVSPRVGLIRPSVCQRWSSIVF